jgi:hypothetical protein
MLDKVSAWWYFSGKYMHKDFIAGVKNLWKWFPVIWRDRNWDHTFIYEILKTKIEFQAEYIGGRDIHTRAKHDASRMQLVARLIERVKDGYYDAEYMDYHESKMVFLDIEDKPDFKKLEINTISEDFDSYLTKYPTWKKRAIQYIKENQNRFTNDHNDKKLVAMIIGDLRQEKAKELIFTIMSREIDGWWD